MFLENTPANPETMHASSCPILAALNAGFPPTTHKLSVTARIATMHSSAFALASGETRAVVAHFVVCGLLHALAHKHLTRPDKAVGHKAETCTPSR